MSNDLLVYMLFFISASLLTASGYRYIARDRVTKERISRRLSAIDVKEADDSPKAIKRKKGLFSSTSWNGLQTIDNWLLQSGLFSEGARVFVWLIILTAGVITGTGVALDFHPVTLPLGLLGSLSLALLVVYMFRSRRIALFQQQLPEVIDTIVRSLRAGHPLPTALSLVSKEAPDPARFEFGIVSDEIAYGLDAPAAMKNLCDRVGAPELIFLHISISVQSKSGGNLAEILERLSHVMRERAKLRDKVRSLTAEGRVSALVLSSLPIIVFGLVSFVNPKYYGDVWHHHTFRTAMAIAALMLLAGNYILRRMVNFKY